jgi:HlyD family secretion protein
MNKHTWLRLGAVVLILIGLIAYVGWRYAKPKDVPNGFAKSNGRIEATDIDIAAKIAGRVTSVEAHEGDFVTAGQVLAHMETDVLQAQLREAEADLRRAKTAVDTAQSTVKQRESEKEAAVAQVAQRQAELDLAQKNLTRAENLVEKAAISREDYDTSVSSFYAHKAASSSSQAIVAGADAAISTAKSQVIQAEAEVGAAQARIERLQADINDSTLKATREGRVQFRIAEPGEVLNAGGKVLNMVDLNDVYMTFFLPTDWAGLVKVGADTHIVLDAAPQFVIPAKVTFVADVAQFTPKTVETAEERQKLTFRVKAHIPAELLKEHVRDIKTGLPGVAYVQLDANTPWPETLQVKLPQ